MTEGVSLQHYRWSANLVASWSIPKVLPRGPLMDFCDPQGRADGLKLIGYMVSMVGRALWSRETMGIERANSLGSMLAALNFLN